MNTPAQRVTISTATTGAVIRYSTDGSTLTVTGPPQRMPAARCCEEPAPGSKNNPETTALIAPVCVTLMTTW
jgi:hypothetical protein